MTNVALYLRKSRDEENESRDVTLARHERMLTDYCDRNDLIIKIVKNIDTYLNDFTNDIYMKEYQNSSCIVGKEVELNIRGDIFKATVLKINDEGELVVRTHDNKELTVYSGEITRLVLNDK